MAVDSNVTTCFLSNSYCRKDWTCFFYIFESEREILEKVAATSHEILIPYLLSNMALFV